MPIPVLEQRKPAFTPGYSVRLLARIVRPTFRQRNGLLGPAYSRVRYATEPNGGHFTR